jgi:hypothetical protein
LAQFAIYGLLGAALLWGIVPRLGPRLGTATIHVTRPDVVVSVGDQVFRVGDETEVPLVCELPAGTHTLTVLRGDEVLDEQTFTLEGGKDVVLTTFLRGAESRPLSPSPAFLLGHRPTPAARGETR